LQPFPLRSIKAPMLTTDQLRAKALLALEDALQECRYRKPRRSYALRFALAWLWATSDADRRPFENFWRSLGAEKTPWSFGVADSALSEVYRALRVERDDAVSFAMWGRHSADEAKLD
jgi:hypothetical protein